MQEEVDEVYTELVKAFLNLRLVPNKDLLEELINKAKRFEAANYSVASYANLVETLNVVKEVYENPNATQEEVTNAVNSLTKAIAGLEEVNPPVENSTNTPTEAVKPGDTTKAIKTGDNAVVGVFAGIAMLSIAGYLVLNKKRDL